MSRRDVDGFLDRSEAVLADDTALAACAWCSHPLDDESPSGEFCGEHCAAYWRAGCDWYPEERCACWTCDPEWHQRYAEPGTITVRRDSAVISWLGAVRAARDWADEAQRASTVRGIFQTRPDLYRERAAAEPGTAVHRMMENFRVQAASPGVRDRVDMHAVNRWVTDQLQRRWHLGIDVARESAVTAAHYDEAGNLVVETDLSGWSDPRLVESGDVPTPYLRDLSADLPPASFERGWLGGSVTHVIVDEAYSFDRTWMATWAWAESAEPERPPRWAGRKPNRKRRKRRS